MSTDNETLIEFKNVSKAFGDKVVLSGLDLKVQKGKITAFIGKSGTGKSVLLKHIARLLEPDSGEIYYKGTPYSTLSAAQNKELKGKFSYMFQNNALFDSLTAYQNVALPLEERKTLSKKQIEDKITHLFELLDIKDIQNKYMAQISGGMQKRVALARALVTDPEVVLFDEPTTGLDPIRKNTVLNLIVEYQRKLGFTSIIVSHDIPDVFYIADQVAILNNTQITFSDSPIHLDQIKDPELQVFLNSEEKLLDDLAGFAHKEDLVGACQSKNSTVRLYSIDRLWDIRKNTGHITAEKLLHTLAQAINLSKSKTDMPCRFNESTIAVVFENSNENIAKFEEQVNNNLKESLLLKEIENSDIYFNIHIIQESPDKIVDSFGVRMDVKNTQILFSFNCQNA